MHRILGIAVILAVGWLGWHIGESLTTDGLSMAIGVLFGLMAAIPAALIAASASRNVRQAVYHHHEHKTLVEPEKQVAKRLSVVPRAVIILPSVKRPTALQTPARSRLEVK